MEATASFWQDLTVKPELMIFPPTSFYQPGAREVREPAGPKIALRFPRLSVGVCKGSMQLLDPLSLYVCVLQHLILNCSLKTCPVILHQT